MTGGEFVNKLSNIPSDYELKFFNFSGQIVSMSFWNSDKDKHEFYINLIC